MYLFYLDNSLLSPCNAFFKKNDTDTEEQKEQQQQQQVYGPMQKRDARTGSTLTGHRDEQHQTKQSVPLQQKHHFKSHFLPATLQLAQNAPGVHISWLEPQHDDGQETSPACLHSVNNLARPFLKRVWVLILAATKRLWVWLKGDRFSRWKMLHVTDVWQHMVQAGTLAFYYQTSAARVSLCPFGSFIKEEKTPQMVPMATFAIYFNWPPGIKLNFALGSKLE